MKIEDNGCGFDLNRTANQKGIGLESIRTRTKAIGAKLEITSQLNRGTKIQIITEI